MTLSKYLPGADTLGKANFLVIWSDNVKMTFIKLLLTNNIL